jgi:hypothetical protein
MEDIEERNVTWKFVLAFLLGSIFAEFTADPISDWLFFKRVSTGQPLEPVESILYWYYLPALVYTCFFVLAYILMRKRVLKAKHFVYFILFLAGLGMWKSLEGFGYSKITILLLMLPFLLLTFVLLFKRKKS